MADDDLPPRLPGQLDVYDCIRIAESNEDGAGEPKPTFAVFDELHRHKPPTPLGKPKALTAAEVVALRLKGKNDES